MKQMSAESVDHGACSTIKLLLMPLRAFATAYNSEEERYCNSDGSVSSLSRTWMPALNEAHTNHTEIPPKIPKSNVVSQVGYKQGCLLIVILRANTPTSEPSPCEATPAPGILHRSCLHRKLERHPEKSIHGLVQERSGWQMNLHKFPFPGDLF